MFKEAIIIQPPLVQLNTAYPSGAYLNSFFKNQNLNSKWYDLSIELFNSIFSSDGLKKLFSLTEQKALSLAHDAQKNGDAATAENLTAYILQKKLWIEWIDDIMNILRDGIDLSTREICHKFIYSPFVPRGNRMNNYMENADHEITIDDARNLATMAVEDLADYIAFVYDKNFSLIRYAESITVNEHSFEQIEKTLCSPLLNDFYAPILENKFNLKINEDEKILVCISVPFAGTFTAALFTAKFFKEMFGDKVFVSLGGGFVNTELRDFAEKSFCKYADALSFDRGYGSYIQLLENKKAPVYNMRLFSESEIFEPLFADDVQCMEIVKIENEITSSTVPDYSDIDFSKYPRMADDTNPMQRMWSDGTWLKAYLAHGCYWHKCSFCDVTLDYVKSYRMTCVDKIFDGLSEQCKNKKISGIHFVDEALPPAAVKKFSLLNMKKNNSALSFWGNVRFEKVWNRDITDLCAKGGLIGVSGGIEIATGSGLDKISKGTDLESIVSACCAFKESGILIHAYMIFGYYGESEQDIINSMETLRQFFEAGLLDSCFWHKFVLTRHSRLYDEWQKGLHKNLKPYENKNSGIFAKNGIHFEGEETYEKYSEGLNQSLQNWMHGKGINKSVNKWFQFKTKEPTVSKNLVADAIRKYEEKRDSLYSKDFEIEKQKPVWICDGMILSGNKLMWSYMQETYRMKNVNTDFFESLKCLEPSEYDPSKISELIKKDPQAKQKLMYLRGRGLII
jgi:radical SAM superfamily enzyme YgiQ (UPF0313 family)